MRDGITPGAITLADLTAAFEAIKNAPPSPPRHDCRFDGHVLQFNPWGFAACVFCGASEADTERLT